MKRLTTLIVISIAITGTVMAQTNNTTEQPQENQIQNISVDTAILTSSMTYQDTMISSQVSEKIGAPVLLTENNTTSEPTADVLEEIGAENIVIVGGPAVVSESVEDNLSEQYSVDRVFGAQAENTSVAVSERFWPEGAEQVNLVEEDITTLTAVKNANEYPILVTEGNVSQQIIDELNRLGPEQVNIYSTENITNLPEDVPTERFDSVERNLSGNFSTLVVTSAQNQSYLTAAPYVPDAQQIAVESPDAVPTQVQAEEVWAIGSEEFTSEVTEGFSDNSTVVGFTGSNIEIAAETVSMKLDAWSQAFQDYLMEGEQTTEDNMSQDNQTDQNTTETEAPNTSNNTSDTAPTP